MGDTEDKKIKLKWIHSSDTHSNLFGYNYQNGKGIGNGLSSVYEYVSRQRNEYGESLLVTDGGDCLQGEPIAYYYNFIDTDRPHLVAEVMNEIGYDCGVMGNHDIEVGMPTFERWMNDCSFPILGANVVDRHTEQTYLKPYIILNRCGIKIAILGLVTPVIPYYQPNMLWQELKFEEVLPCAKYWCDYIHLKEQPDLMVCLLHSGFEGGVVVKGKCYENVAKKLAEQVTGIDMICYGHDHVPAVHRVRNTEGKDVVCMGSFCMFGFLAEADIEVTFRNGVIESKTIKERMVEVYKIQELSENSALKQKYSSSEGEVAGWSMKPLCQLTETLDERMSLSGTCRFMDYIHRIQMDMVGAEISVATPFSHNTCLRRGVLHIGDLFPLLAYEEFVYSIRLRGEEIKGMLEVSYGKIQKRRASLLNMGKSVVARLVRRPFNWYFGNNCYTAAGIDYTVDITKPVGNRISITSMSNGSSFDMGKEYCVAVNRRLAFDKKGCLYVGAGLTQEDFVRRIVSISSKALPYFMMNQMEKQRVVRPLIEGQWSFCNRKFNKYYK